MPQLRPSQLSIAACAALLAASVGAELHAGGPATDGASTSTVLEIERYFAASWRNARVPDGEWADLSQGSFVELLERLPQSDWLRALRERESEERRELNRAVWCILKRYQRSPRSQALVADGADLPALAPSAEESPAVSAECLRLRAALEQLSSRQRETLTRWAGGQTIAEIAEALEITQVQASDAKYKGLRRLESVLAETA